MARDASEDERRPLLADESLSGQQQLPRGASKDPYANLPVYATIHRVRLEVIASLDDPYSLEQLRAPRINVSVVRPLVNRLWEIRDVSIIYCLLVNKLNFLREQGFQAHQTIYTTRAMLCELVALKILRRLDEETPNSEGLLLISNVMAVSFSPFQNAPKEVVKESGHAYDATHKEFTNRKRSPTLEIAIISDSKLLISSPACQRVMEAIYVGRIVYTPSSFIDILPDYYKRKPISLYRPEHAPLLNQYRLMVPRIRNILDIFQFLFLLVLYILVMQHRNYHEFTPYELIFCIYGLGWVLDELASILEHGWHCYTQNLWSFLDAIFALLFLTYFSLRMHSLAIGDHVNSGPAALDILSAAAPVLIPRLAFNLMSENMLFVSLRAMMSNFIILTFLAAWCSAGFLLSLAWLSRDRLGHLTISKWMLYVWFGLDGTGISESVYINRIIGPILMVTFAFLGNTLFLTILVSMLNHTFAKIATNATAEIQFRRAVLTFEGVKADSIFNYMPPFNILALCIMLPLKAFVLSPRWFHKVNVALIRTLNAPLLLGIHIFERRHLWSDHYASFTLPSDSSTEGIGIGSLTRKFVAFSQWLLGFGDWWDMSRWSVHGDIEAVFDFDPPESVKQACPAPTNNGNNNNRTQDQIGGKNVPIAPHSQLQRRHTQTQSTSTTAEGSAPPLPSQGAQLPPNTKSPPTAPAKTPKRRDSYGTMHGVNEHLADLLHEHGITEAMNTRFEALEEGNRRLERLLLRLSNNLCDEEDSVVGDGDAGGGSVGDVERGTIESGGSGDGEQGGGNGEHGEAGAGGAGES